MELQVTGKNIHLTFEVRSYLENKIQTFGCSVCNSFDQVFSFFYNF